MSFTVMSAIGRILASMSFLVATHARVVRHDNDAAAFFLLTSLLFILMAILDQLRAVPPADQTGARP